jgi:hypothetical protein
MKTENNSSTMIHQFLLSWIMNLDRVIILGKNRTEKSKTKRKD